NALAIKDAYPTLDAQYEYWRRVCALRDYTRTKEMAIAHIEAEAAMAMTIAEMRERGELCKDGQTTQKTGADRLSGLLSISDDAAAQAVHRWSEVAAIPTSDRLNWYETSPKISRDGLVRWHQGRVETAKTVKVPKTDKAGNKLCKRLLAAF